jgi:8-oxo-dGTP pyrophosphatase MutT (NUDIX family)
MGYIAEMRKIVGYRPLIMVGACVLVVDHNDRLLLQLRKDNNCWGLPGGSMDLGESLQEVAIRELLEETGLVAKGMTLFNVYSGEEFYYKYPHGDEVYNVVATFLCRKYEGELRKEESEVQELKFFSIDDLPNNLSPPDMPIIHDYIKSFI